MRSHFELSCILRCVASRIKRGMSHALWIYAILIAFMDLIWLRVLGDRRVPVPHHKQII